MEPPGRHHPLTAPGPFAPGQELSLYVHLPFCDVRCPYCHFYCFVNRDAGLPDRYVRGLAAELELWAQRGLDGPVASVYFGGGTPSALPPGARERICDWLAHGVGPRLAPGAEITMEVNPESAWPEGLQDWVGAGVNRISLGIQSMVPGVLEFLGRLNTPRSNLRALDLACSLVPSVSCDLILATPADDWSGTLRSLEAICSRPVQHVSGYLLEVHRDTRFGRDVARGKWAPKPGDDQAALYHRAVDWLAGRGLVAYELSNFALPGHEAAHNRRYWRREPYLGLGASAHSFADEQRWWDVADARQWCERVEAGELPVAGHERLGEPERRREQLLLGLRTREGVPLTALRGREQKLAALAAAGLLRRDGGRVAATVDGWLVLDDLVAQLVD